MLLGLARLDIGSPGPDAVDMANSVRSLVLALVLVPAPLVVSAQEAGPLTAVQALFDAMRVADAEAARAVMATGVRFAVLGPDAGIAVQTLDSFLAAMRASEGAWDEQIYDVEVREDDAMASVWAPFTFYLDGEVSHCGVNSIELLRDAEGWKITQISDTRRTEGCPDPLGG